MKSIEILFVKFFGGSYYDHETDNTYWQLGYVPYFIFIIGYQSRKWFTKKKLSIKITYNKFLIKRLEKRLKKYYERHPESPRHIQHHKTPKEHQKL